MSKIFEIPYNFDKQLIDFLCIYKSINIHCIYCAPFRAHYKSAKYYYENIPLNTPRNLHEYEDHIFYINKYFPNKLMLLLQQNDILLSEELLNYYISLGFTKFCVGSIEQANMIRQKSKDYEIIGSITTKINNQKLLQNNYSSFNGFVLWFPFNRDIEAIKQLPKNFYYILLVNCGCSRLCDGTQHWLAITKSQEDQARNNCPKKKNNSFKDNIIIPNCDLQFFEPYIKYYKLQGREFNTTQIIDDIVRYNHYNFCNIPIIRDYDPNIIYHIK